MTNTTHPLDKIREPLTGEMFRLNVQKTFEGDFFSICGVRDGIKLINPGGDVILNEIHSLHCINWSEMSPEMTRHVIDTVARAMVYSPVLLALNDIDPEVNEAKAVLRDILIPRRRRMKEEVSNAVEDATTVEGEVVPESPKKVFKLPSFSRSK